MKKLILGLTLLASASSFAQYDLEQVAALTNLHFCVLMADGTEISNDLDGIVWEGLNCNEAIENAQAAGCSDDDIREQVLASFKESAISQLKECAMEMSETADSCKSLVNKAKELGMTRSEIDQELGAFRYFID